MAQTDSNLTTALAYIDAGISVIPADATTKIPCLPNNAKWGPYQQRVATHDEAVQFWNNGQAIAAIGGVVSGNLEIIDFDEDGIIKEWATLLKSWNCGYILDKVLVESTQRKGRRHVAYRHSGPPEGPQKLARRPATPEELKAKPSQKEYGRIETKGEGGYCLIAPSRGYTLKQGDWTKLPTITADEREVLLNAARTFDQLPKCYALNDLTGNRVGDDYNRRASIDEILIPLGWKRSGHEGWIRPGKGKGQGISATWNHQGNNHFCVFTTSVAGLDPGNYDLFGLFARLCHDNNFTEATKAAARSGYGPPKPFNSPSKNYKAVAAEERKERKWVTFEEVEAKPVNWLMEPYLPMGVGYVLLFGDSDAGKSTVTLNWVASFSNGINPHTGDRIEPIKSLILSAEDSASYVVKPRLEKFGANMKMIAAPEEFNEDGTPNPLILDEYGAEELRQEVARTGAKLVIIDPLTTYFDGESMASRQDARTWTRRLTDIAITCNCCIVIVHHVNKGQDKKGRYRAADSQDFYDASRSALMIVADPNEENAFALTHIKHNLQFQGPSLGYKFSREQGFQWTGESDLTPDMATTEQEEHVPPSKLAACKAWIMEQVESTGELGAKDAYKGLELEGYSAATIRRAKQELSDRIQSKQVSRNGKNEWVWRPKSYGWDGND